MIAWVKHKIYRIGRRISQFRKSPSWGTFVAVFWALIAVEVVKWFVADFEAAVIAVLRFVGLIAG